MQRLKAPYLRGLVGNNKLTAPYKIVYSFLVCKSIAQYMEEVGEFGNVDFVDENCVDRYIPMCKVPVSSIARSVNLERRSVSEIIGKLEDDGVIQSGNIAYHHIARDGYFVLKTNKTYIDDKGKVKQLSKELLVLYSYLVDMYESLHARDASIKGLKIHTRKLVEIFGKEKRAMEDLMYRLRRTGLIKRKYTNEYDKIGIIVFV